MSDALAVYRKLLTRHKKQRLIHHPKTGSKGIHGLNSYPLAAMIKLQIGPYRQPVSFEIRIENM